MNRAGATREFREFVAKHRLPVVTTLMAKGHVPEEGSQLVGVVGRARRDIVAEYYKPADLVVAIGYDPVEFNYEDWVRKDLPLIHIDTVPADIASGYSLAGEIVGDIRRDPQGLLKMDRLEHQWDLDALKAHRRKLRQALTPPQTNFSPHHALLAMRELMPAEGLLVADVGAHTHIIGQLWDTKGPGNFLVSNGWSSMGFGIPAAIAGQTDPATAAGRRLRGGRGIPDEGGRDQHRGASASAGGLRRLPGPFPEPDQGEAIAEGIPPLWG